MKKILLVTIIISITLLLLGCTCSNGKYTKKELAIDTSFLNVFYSIANNNQLVFISKSGEKQFVISDIDSIIRNSKGGFMGGGSYKDLFLTINEIGSDTTVLVRPNEVRVHRDPENNFTGITVKFSNLYYHKKYIPVCRKDTIVDNRKIEKYFLFQTSLHSEQPDDVVELYITLDKGIEAYKTFCGEFWFRKDK